MKKRLASLLVCAALLLGTLPGAAAFSDIPDAQTAQAAAVLQGLGVVSGMPDGTFQPGGTLTRAQVCVMAVNAMGLADQVNSYTRKTLFSDVPAGSWYNGFVNLAYSKGIINGYGDGRFGPDDLITYGQLSTILLRMLGYTTADIGPFWPTDYTAFAAELGLSEGLTLGDHQAVTRGDGALLFYRAMTTNTKGSDRAYYRSISGLGTTSQVILLDTDAAYAGSTGLLIACTMQGELVRYSQSRVQSAALEGTLGQLLLDKNGAVMGFIPESGNVEDVTISSATAAVLKDVSGRSIRVSADATVIEGGETYTYYNGGYLRLQKHQGGAARVFYDGDGGVLCIYLGGGTAAPSQAVVADIDQPLAEFERAFGLKAGAYTLTKNGAVAGADSLARHDVAYFDASSRTLRVSDYKVEGELESAAPSLTAAQTITVSGVQIPVLECAWESLENFEVGDKVAVLLTDDGKAAALYRPSAVDCGMVGILDTQGRGVTLLGSGVTLKAENMDYDRGTPGTLVRVKVSGDELVCTPLSGEELTLDVTGRTLGDYVLAPACAVYQWTGSGWVTSLEGERGQSSAGLEAVAALSDVQVDAWHLNSAGQVDVLLLRDVNGELYTYGEITLRTGNDGVAVGDRDNLNDAITVTNASGVSDKYLCTISVREGTYAGVALGSGLNDTGKAVKVQALVELKVVHGEDFYRADGQWYVEAEGEVWPVSDALQLHDTRGESWSAGMDGLMAALADGRTLTLYADRSAEAGGQIRIAAVR